MTCEKCGADYGIGDWYNCPHGRFAGAIQPDELIGGFWQENFTETPEYFTSKKAMLQRADDLGLRQFGECDRKKRQFAITSKTLNDARALLSRGSDTCS